jgi:Peptidase_C39 like family
MRYSRRAALPQLGRWSLRVRGPKRFRFAAWAITALAIGALGLAVVMPYWLPRTVRAIIPDRYVAAYAPKVIQDVVFARVGGEFVPEFSPQASSGESAQLHNLLTAATPANIGSQASTVTLSDSADSIAESSAAATATSIPLPPLPASYSLGGSNFRDTPQKWNNCGPATLTMLLSFWGQTVTQDDVAGFVKPNPEDRNVRPDELAAYVESIGYHMVVRMNGNLDILKRFIASGYPVMIEQGFDVEDKGWMGHYVLLYAYSDADAAFTAMDSYLGAGHVYTYAHIQTYWRQFNRPYLVVYRPEQSAEVAAIIGPETDDTIMYRDALQVAQTEVAQSPGDTFGWFNLGSSLVALGDYANGAAAYDAAYNTGKVPWRMLWYQFGPYEAYLNASRYQDVITLADRTLFDDVYSEEAYYFKSRAYLGQGDTAGARRQLELALLYNKHYQTAQAALNRLVQP